MTTLGGEECPPVGERVQYDPGPLGRPISPYAVRSVSAGPRQGRAPRHLPARAGLFRGAAPTRRNNPARAGDTRPEGGGNVSGRYIWAIVRADKGRCLSARGIRDLAREPRKEATDEPAHRPAGVRGPRPPPRVADARLRAAQAAQRRARRVPGAVLRDPLPLPEVADPATAHRPVDC